MPKNVSVYLPDDLLEKLAAHPEVNPSQIMRKSLEDYLEGRIAERAAFLRVTDLEARVLRLESMKTIEETE